MILKSLRRIASHWQRIFIPALLVLSALVLASCGRISLFAPGDAILTVYADKTYLGTGGEKATLTVLGFTVEGEPLHDHTSVILMTTLGEIKPMEVELIEGKAVAEFTSNQRSGVAHITARSGKAVSNPTLDIVIGSAGLKILSIIADPAHFDPGGGRSWITVFAWDENSNPLADISVILTSTSGHFERGGGAQLTDARGMVEAVLRVSQDCTVKAKSGDKEATVDIKVDQNKPPIADFSFSPPSPEKGEKVYFNGELSRDEDGYIVSYYWDFGDGFTASGAQVSHSFTWSGTTDKSFNVVLKVTDNQGASHFIQKSITVLNET